MHSKASPKQNNKTGAEGTNGVRHYSRRASLVRKSYRLAKKHDLSDMEAAQQYLLDTGLVGALLGARLV